jgi:DNA-binding NtrC family response regulator
VRQGDGAASLQSPSGVPGAEHTGSDSPEASNATGVFVPLGVPLEEVQRLYVLQTLAQCQNNKTRAAKVLGVSRKTLYDRLARWQDSAE